MALATDFASPRFFADPYAADDDLRRHDPVYHGERAGRWSVTRYADVDASLRDPRWLKGQNMGNLMKLRSAEMQWEIQPFASSTSKQLLFSGPPDHIRRRGLVNKAFTPRVVERWRRQSSPLPSLLTGVGRGACIASRGTSLTPTRSPYLSFRKPGCSRVISTTKIVSVPPIRIMVQAPPMWSTAVPKGAAESGESDQVIM